MVILRPLGNPQRRRTPAGKSQLQTPYLQAVSSQFLVHAPAPGSAPVDPSPAPVPAAPAVPVGGLVLTPQQVDSLKQSLGTLSQVLGVGGSGAPPAGGHNVLFTVPTVAKGEKVCQVCKRTFWSSSRLRVHMSSHSKTGLKCAKCGKQFTTI